MESALLFTVRRKEPVLVPPAKRTPHEFKFLSDIDDQPGWRLLVTNILIYRCNPSQQGRDPVRVFKEALAKALVHYYPVAGRLREGPNQKLMVECTGEGVLFIEADAEVLLDELVKDDKLLPPIPCMEELLFDVEGSAGIVNCPLMLIQVTRLLCGGFIVAFRINHTMGDATGVVQFMKAVGELASGADRPSVPAIWSRDLLSARNPPRMTCDHREYKEVHTMNDTTPPPEDAICRSFFLGPKHLDALRSQLPPHLRNLSSNFDVITACFWKCRTIALGMDPEDEVRVLCICDGRNKCNPPIPVGYYGNGIVTPAAFTTSEKLRKNPLGYAVELIKKAKALVTDEYMKSLPDMLVLKNKPQYNLQNTYLTSDLSRAGFNTVDLGWGKPVFGGPAVGSFFVNFLVPYRNPKGEDGFVVAVYLQAPAMERFAAAVEKMTASNQLVEKADQDYPVLMRSAL